MSLNNWSYLSTFMTSIIALLVLELLSVSNVCLTMPLDVQGSYGPTARHGEEQRSNRRHERLDSFLGDDVVVDDDQLAAVAESRTAANFPNTEWIEEDTRHVVQQDLSDSDVFVNSPRIGHIKEPSSAAPVSQLTQRNDEEDETHKGQSETEKGTHAGQGEEVDTRARRTRRSSVWLMHAAMRMCERHRRPCRTIDIDDGLLRISIKLKEK